QRTPPSRRPAQVERQTRSPSHCGGLHAGAHRPTPLDPATTGRPSHRVGLCGLDCPRDPAPDSQKNTLKPWQHPQWCLPEVSGEFVAAREDVLDLYAEPYDPKRPKVNFDESSKQLIGETRPPLPAQPGQ